MTLRLYASGKSLELDPVRVEVGHSRTSDGADRFARRLHLQGELSAEQRTRLIEIAERCPVHRTLERGSAIETAAGDARRAKVERPTQHGLDMEEICSDESRTS